VFVPQATVAAQLHTQAAISVDGAVATAYVVAPFRPGVDFSIVLMDGPGTGTAPSTSSVDIRQPWIGVEEASATTVGMLGPIVCQTMTNPSVATSTGAGGLQSYAVTVACADGSAFDHYTIQWLPTGSLAGPTSVQGVPLGMFSYNGEVNWGEAGGDTAAIVYTSSSFEDAQVRICGYTGTLSQCAITPDPYVGMTAGEVWGEGQVHLSNLLMESATTTT
jgi:hypothetical protein